MNWFGKDGDENRDGNSAYSNREGFIFHNYDINDVEESKPEGERESRRSND